MTTRSALKASALAFLAFAPANAEPGSDVGARMQALERQIASLSQQVQNLQIPPPTKAKAPAPDYTILSRTVEPSRNDQTKTEFECGTGFHLEVDGMSVPFCAPDIVGSRAASSMSAMGLSYDTDLAASRGAKQQTRKSAAREGAIQYFSDNVRPDNSGAIVRGNPKEQFRMEPSMANQPLPAQPAQQVRSTAPPNESANRILVNSKLEELSQLLPVAPLDEKGKTSVTVNSVTVNILVPKSGSHYYLYATVGSVANITVQEQQRVMQKVIETLEIDMDSLSINPELDTITYSARHAVSHFSSLSETAMYNKLVHFSKVVSRVAEQLAYEFA